jgi:two-component system NtrC family sensor kinase
VLNGDVHTLPLHRSLPELSRELGSHLFLYHILEGTPNGVLVIGLDHRVMYANDAAHRLLGIKSRNISDPGLAVLLGEDNHWFFYQIGQFFDNINEIWESRIRHEIEIDAGEEEPKIVDAVLVYPPSAPDYYLLYLNDITTMKRLEGQLRRRNAFFNKLITASVDGIIASDMEGNLILFNDAALNLLGYTDRQEFSTIRVTDLYNDNFAYTIIRRMRSDDFGGEGKLLHQELNVRHKEGYDIPVMFSGGIIYDHDQEFATFGIFTDLRAMQQIEEDLEQTHRMLMQSEQMAGLGRLAAGVAHEINNPMSGIMLYANLIREELGAHHPAGADLDTIVSEAERCKVIVADLLDFSHQSSFDMSPVEINEVIRKTLDLLTNQPMYHNITVDLLFQEPLPLIMGNSMRLNQVFMNLLVNSAQAMNGAGTLRIATRSRANGEVNEVIVQDDGPGIPPHLLDKIFDPFFTTKSTGEGTGLGLSVSYAIIKEHKGTIKAQPAPGGGALFTLKFPTVSERLKEEDYGSISYLTGA